MTPRSSRLVALVAALIPSAALGQMGMGGGGRPLGGYGSATIGPYYGSAGVTPFQAGGRVGVIPAPPGRIAETRIGGSSAPSFRDPARGPMAGSRRSSPGGMGMGFGTTVGMPMTRTARGMRGPSPGPGLGWPFTVPPNLSGPAAMGMP